MGKSLVSCFFETQCTDSVTSLVVGKCRACPMQHRLRVATVSHNMSECVLSISSSSVTRPSKMCLIC